MASIVGSFSPFFFTVKSGIHIKSGIHKTDKRKTTVLRSKSVTILQLTMVFDMTVISFF